MYDIHVCACAYMDVCIHVGKYVYRETDKSMCIQVCMYVYMLVNSIEYVCM